MDEIQGDQAVRTSTETLIKAMRIVSDNNNGVVSVATAEAAKRLEEYQDRIKRLEEAGDRMFEIGKRIVHQNGEDMYWIRKLEEELTEWIATKEAKP